MRIPDHRLALSIAMAGIVGIALGRHLVPARGAPAVTSPMPTTAPVDQAELQRFLTGSAAREIEAGWRDVRAEAIGAEALQQALTIFGDELAALPRAIGRHLAQRHSASEDARQDGAVFAALRRALATGSRPDLELVADRERFAEWFAPRIVGTVRDGPTHSDAPDRVLCDGDTLEFGGGVFRLRDLMRSRSPFPRDVTIRGAGMDATLLVHDGELGSPDAVRNLGFEDCTLFGPGDGFVMHAAPLSLRLARVRVVGVDDGATAISARSLALDCEDCRFEGGYGHRVAPCSLLLATSSCAARLARCGFSGMDPGVVGARAAIVFDACRFDASADDLRGRFPDARFVSCGFDGGAGASPRRRELRELFPEFDPNRHR